jgi:hypothetical protein
MHLITHSSHLDALPASPLKQHIQKRFDQLFETEDDLLPNIILVETNDDIAGPDFAFVGPRGLLSDLFDEHEPGHPEFARPYEWASFMPEMHFYEVLLLINGEDGYWIMIQEVVVEAHADLKWILTDESQGGLSDPQPL